MSETTGFILNRPTDDDPGDYLVFITRPSAGLFGTAGTAIFACDTGVQHGAHCLEVPSAAGRITFSKDLPFLIVPRKLTRPVTTKEMAEMQLAEKKEWDAVYEADDQEAYPAALSAVKVTEDGRLKHDSQGYL